jgi:hypothetical protein
VWNSTLDWTKFDHLTLTGGGAKAKAVASNAGGHVRVKVTGATAHSEVTIRLYAKVR